MTDLVLGLDVGTTAVKAAVFDGDNEVATGRAPTPWRTVPTGAEVDADELLAAAVAAAREAVATAGGRIVAIGVASVAETGVLIDKDGRPVVPGIAWHDSRGEEQAQRLADDLPEFSARVGLPASPLCTLAKYRWLRDNVPESARGVRWLNVAEWIVAGLGGEAVGELSLASRTGFLDLHAKRPYDDGLAWADAPAGLVGEPVPAGTPMGTASLPEARGAILTVGGHDHLSAAVGAGAAGDGDVLNSCGTAEAFVRASAPLAPDRVAQAVASGISVGWHAADGRQCLLGAQWSGAWLRDVLALLEIEPEDRAPIEAAALELEQAGPPARTLGGLVVYEALEGLEPAAAYHVALDAVGAGGAEILERMAAVAGPARRLVVTGGWAAGPAARAVKQRHLGPFELSPALATGAARGAAVAAGRAAALQEVM
ncbi:MAG TPA: FGGY family carbohydrate kinase [Solirubrobacteraceae bacterium]|nr:FGGY family carbohydrate kinase [Solirubrobacteraceae bacterium]